MKASVRAYAQRDAEVSYQMFEALAWIALLEEYNSHGNGD